MSETEAKKEAKKKTEYPNMGDPVIPPGQPKGYELDEDQMANREVSELLEQVQNTVNCFAEIFLLISDQKDGLPPDAAGTIGLYFLEAVEKLKRAGEIVHHYDFIVLQHRVLNRRREDEVH